MVILLFSLSNLGRLVFQNFICSCKLRNSENPVPIHIFLPIRVLQLVSITIDFYLSNSPFNSLFPFLNLYYFGCTTKATASNNSNSQKCPALRSFLTHFFFTQFELIEPVLPQLGIHFLYRK